LYFVYPRLHKLSGAERLILRLASHTVALGAPVTLVTHYLDPACAPALSPAVRLLQTGDRLQVSRNHYLNAPFEYLASLRLVRYLPRDADAVLFFGPPSLPALTWASLRRHTSHLTYFCYEPPRFIYDDTAAVTARMGTLGAVARPLFGAYKWLDRRMVRRADALFANSQFGAQRLARAYGRAATVLTHGVDLAPPTADAVRAVRERYALQDRVVFLTVNFLHPRKRIDLFLRALAEWRGGPDTG
jgi:glycosyltransferase involved in cell wall biosynthesis